jgi:hypothetical protein
VPFAVALSHEIAAVFNNDHWNTVEQVFQLLLKAAQIISEKPFVAAALDSCCSKLCILWHALEKEAGNDRAWKMKPKVHMFQELCSNVCFLHGSPENFWTYKDESWCGDMAKSAKRRGGQKHVDTVPTRLLSRFRASTTSDS